MGSSYLSFDKFDRSFNDENFAVDNFENKLNNEVIMSINIEKRFVIPAWDKIALQKTLDFWSRRGMKFTVIESSFILGKRGNFWGNLTSFKMSKLITKFAIYISTKNEIYCRANCKLDIFS
jgi:hypothetical protein